MNLELGADFWFTEYSTPYDGYCRGITRVFAHRRTAFQELYVVESGSYGKALVLDGKWQTCEEDEFLYHEPLVHPACLFAGGPERVLILGGADGGAAREVLKWRSVCEVTLVDIDGEVVEACREYLPEIHQGSLDDPRVTVRIEDALDFLASPKPYWDVIISDLSDPIEHGPAFKLFTREFFSLCRQALRSGGMFVLQAGCTAPVELHMHVRIVNTLKAVFPCVTHFESFVPTWASGMGFALGTDDLDVNFWPPVAEVDRILQEQTSGEFRFLDGEALQGLMHTPKHLRDAVAAETHVYSLADPPKMYGKGRADKSE